jgi:hypothetical protein
LGGSKKSGIRRSLERLLIAELLARGFEHWPETIDSRRSPFGVMRRRTERGIELIEVRFNKYRTSHFNFHIAHVTSEKTVWKDPKPMEQQLPFDVDPNFVVWRRGLVFRRWFGVKKYAREGIRDEEFDTAVRQALGYLPMIEAYFQRGNRTLAMEKYPQGLRDDLAYWSVCTFAVIGSIWGLVWGVGWLWRHLFW